MLTSLITLAIASAVASPVADAPKWESDYGKALEQVRSDDRPLLVVLDKPGEEVDAKLLSAKDDKTLQKYDLCRIDASTEYGKKVAAAFNAKTFPHVAFVDKTGEVVLHTHKGKISKDAWNASLTKYQTGAQPERHVVLRPASEAQPVMQYEPVYRDNSYCPSCQKGF
ncbi:hypothetical protein KOR34_30870 [Posidoniimonas corsicana]|uniref:Thioredoxin domain-containing protein n=1 Tax=Posidoniimonas corsicana TaxID=1938618 RepID=A0A5C5VJR0_9BACT|nr:hypothetical protein [Posidoniimonas corsicana]TWT38119.1 hypothetical protein KOR34_30870 [Posidoniimonas corsicana]